MLRGVRSPIPIFFFVSGAAGLVYQVAWSRSALDIFGSTLQSMSTMLAVFMGGLAGGSFIFGHLAGRPKWRALYSYAILEAAIGAYALFTPTLFQLIQVAETSLH